MLQLSKRIMVFFCLIQAIFLLQADSKTSKTVFVPRSLLTDSTYENALNNFRNFSTDSEGNKQSTHSKNFTTFMMQPLYIGSESAKGLARYFLFNDKTQLRVTEQAGGDIASSYLGLEATEGKFFDSTFKIRPSRTVLGAILSIHGNLDNLTKGLYFEARAPFVRVRQDIKFKDLGITNVELDAQDATKNQGLVPSGSDATIQKLIDAFNQPSWRYGKLSPTKLVQDGIDDALVRLGYSFVNKENVLFNLYGDFIVPLGESVNGEFIFEPKVGSEHFGVGIGAMVDGLVYEHKQHTVSIVADARYHYRFSAPEVRSMDLIKNGPWSRYLPVARQYASEQSVDGINLFTRDVDVHPRGSFELLTLMHYQNSNLHVELGWNFWTREKESIELNDHWESNIEQLGIFDEKAFGISGPTASNATIGVPPTDVIVDSSFVRITEKDFNLGSAAHDRTISNKLFAGLSFEHSVFNFPARTGFGGSYEFGTSNTALDQWSVWVNAMIRF